MLWWLGDVPQLGRRCRDALADRGNQVAEDAFVLEFRELFAELRIQMIGPIRQELLTLTLRHCLKETLTRL